MGIEIERKFLVSDHSFKDLAYNSEYIRQGYLSRNPDCTVRLRIRGNRAFLTVKGRNNGLVRKEFEYEIPVKDAGEMFGLCEGGVIEKTRHLINYSGNLWEIDEFHGDLRGLVLAEVELKSKDEVVALPPFIGKEVSDDPRYYNSNLLKLDFQDAEY